MGNRLHKNNARQITCRVLFLFLILSQKFSLSTSVFLCYRLNPKRQINRSATKFSRRHLLRHRCFAKIRRYSDCIDWRDYPNCPNTHDYSDCADWHNRLVVVAYVYIRKFHVFYSCYHLLPIKYLSLLLRKTNRNIIYFINIRISLPQGRIHSFASIKCCEYMSKKVSHHLNVSYFLMSCSEFKSSFNTESAIWLLIN